MYISVRWCRRRGDKVVILVVDALDELENGPSRKRLLELIAQTIPLACPNVRLIVTSRRESDIKDALQHLNRVEIQKDKEAQREDIVKFIEKRIVPLVSCDRAAMPETESDEMVRAERGESYQQQR